MTRANFDARRGGQAELTEAVERLVAALGGREAVLGSASETITATGWRHQLALRGPTHLVPAELDYVEVGNGSAGHVTGVDFMFDPRPVDVAIPSWRVAARVRHLDMTSP